MSNLIPRWYKVSFEDGTIFEVKTFDAIDSFHTAAIKWSAHNPGLDLPALKDIVGFIKGSEIKETLDNVFNMISDKSKRFKN